MLCWRPWNEGNPLSEEPLAQSPPSSERAVAETLALLCFYQKNGVFRVHPRKCLDMKILVPTDFSDNAKNAFEFAKQLAIADRSTITLLFAYYNVYDFAAQSSSIMAQIQESAEKAMEEFRGLEKDIKVNHKIVEGAIATAVTSTAYREEYDLIVMGTQGASGIRKALIGSNTSLVIKDSMVPVLAVPAHSDYSKVQEIVVSIEWERSEQKFFEKLFQIAQQWEWPYKTLHIQAPGEEDEEKIPQRLEGFLDKSFPGMEHVSLSSDDLLEGISHYLDQAEDCLLVMFSKHKPFFEYLFDKGHVEKMAYHTHVPLLVIK